MCFFRRKKNFIFITDLIKSIGGKSNIKSIDIVNNKATIILNDKNLINKQGLQELSKGIMIQSSGLTLFLDNDKLKQLKTFSTGGK